MMTSVVKTTCPYCGVGCGIDATVENGQLVSVTGDPQHPANQGCLCVKGAALAETVGIENRLLSPLINGQPVSWDEALDKVADGFTQTIEQYGPDSVAMYVSGQILTEDYYVANKLVKGFWGTANIDTNSRLCMSSAVAAHKRAFGADSVPACYEDIEQADLILLVGSNAAWTHPVIYQRIVKAKKQNPELKVIVIDPRKTVSCDIADMHLALKPGSDAFLFNGLLCFLDKHGFLAPEFILEHCNGFEEALEKAHQSVRNLADLAEVCELNYDEIEQFYLQFAQTHKVISLFSQGINQSSSGVDKGNSIINCHLATGRIGKVGMGPFSLTGQPNAMGGREVGGLANQLACHMDLDNPRHHDLVSRFWQTERLPTQPGLKAVDMYQAVLDGRIKAIWIMATNPAVSMPDSQLVRQALQKCPLVVVSDCVENSDTGQFADIVLPAQTWGEKEGTVTNSERRISRQRKLIEAPGEARSDWWTITQVAHKMGFSDSFSYQECVDIFREYAQLSGFENHQPISRESTKEKARENEQTVGVARDFNISLLDQISSEQYENLQPIQWPITKSMPQGTARLFTDGQFFTVNGRANLIPVTPRLAHAEPNDDYPFVLNTGRIRDQWHTMTRTGKSARLMAHRDQPFVDIHPDDAERLGLIEGQLVEIVSPKGQVMVRIQVDPAQKVGELFIPIHWNDGFASQAVVNELLFSHRDPISGQPEFKQTAVAIKTYEPQWYGFLITRQPVELSGLDYWCQIKGEGCYRYEIAGRIKPENWHEWVLDQVKPWLDYTLQAEDMVRFKDPSQGNYRDAIIIHEQLQAVLFISSDKSTYSIPNHEWVSTLFSQNILAEDRKSLLSGQPAEAKLDVGKIICSCFNTGLNTIVDSIKNDGINSVEDLGEKLKCGTNCGSCVPELGKIVLEYAKD